MNILTAAKTFIKAKGPFITTGLALITGGITVYMGIKAAPLYSRAVEEAKKDAEEYGKEFTKMDHAKMAVKHFGPTFAMGAVTGGLMVSTLILEEKKAEDAIGGIAAAYALSETRVKDMIKAQKEELSKKDQDAVKSNVADQVLKRTPVSERTFHSADGTDKMVVKDGITSSEGKLTASDILEGELWLNTEMQKEHGKNDVSLNELLEHLGMETCDAGDEYIFSHRFDEDHVKLEIIGRYDDDHGRLVGVLDYDPRPTNSAGYY